jgi:hypothetical protein
MGGGGARGDTGSQRPPGGCCVVELGWAGLGCIWFGPVAALQRADDFDLVQLIREFHRVLCAVKKEVNHEEQSPGQYFWHPPLIYTLPRSLFLARRI